MPRVLDLIKTYRHVNDPKGTGWNVMWGGSLVLALAAGAFLAYAWTAEDVAPYTAPGPAARGEDEPAAEPQTVYVGLAPASYDPLAGPPPDADAAYASWRAEHPQARVLAKDPVEVGGARLGYHVTYVP